MLFNKIVLIGQLPSELVISRMEKHKNIKFTVEHESETFPFLDVAVTITDSGIETKIYRKQTHTNLLLYLNAICRIH